MLGGVLWRRWCGLTWLLCWCQVDFDIARYYGSAGKVRVRYTTTAGTAHPAPDQRALYVPASGWLVFSDGGLGQQTVSVMLLDNGLLEGPQTFYVNITHLELIEPRSDCILLLLLLLLHRESKKRRHYTLVHIFAKYWPIFTRDSIYAVACICCGNSVCLSVRPSVCLSVCHTGGSAKNGWS